MVRNEELEHPRTLQAWKELLKYPRVTVDVFLMAYELLAIINGLMCKEEGTLLQLYGSLIIFHLRVMYLVLY